MAESHTFQSNAEAFEYACTQLDCSLKDGKPVLAVVLGVQGRMCSVKIANREDPSIPEGTLTELLARADLASVCFSAMLADNVPNLRVGDLVMYTTMPELAAAGKATVAGTVVSRVLPHYTSKGGWQVEPKKTAAPPPPAPDGTPDPSQIP
jgi:hypothetical protein